MKKSDDEFHRRRVVVALKDIFSANHSLSHHLRYCSGPGYKKMAVAVSRRIEKLQQVIDPDANKAGDIY